MRRLRSAKIVATLGPATSDEPAIRALFERGVDVFRLNFSHGTQHDHARRLETIRRLEKEFGRPIGVLLDLQGPKLRLGTFEGGRAQLEALARFRLDMDRASGNSRRAPLPHPEIFAALRKAPSCCSTTASCGCASTATAPTSPRPPCWWAGPSPTARASTCPACCCRSRR